MYLYQYAFDYFRPNLEKCLYKGGKIEDIKIKLYFTDDTLNGKFYEFFISCWSKKIEIKIN